LFSSTVVHFLVQPNLKPPITTTEQALAYRAELKRIDPDVQYLMTLYLSPDLTPDEVRKAKKAGIVGQNRSSVQIVFSNRQSRRS
jgi:dihydroorotase